ncbi:MAG: shikimate kinase [Lachnospiraceae bacterium]|nr:shikimate kinase [Lachnospira sp.]MBR6697272.1 shikimate kinase [Lachnospiraceae bacterium]
MNNIILEGFMGSGKTTLGKELANSLGFSFVDTDEYIENKYNRIIKDIFANEGEEYFRDMETEAIEELSKKDSMVIALGGGLPVREVNREILKKTGKVIYLKAKVSTLCDRLKNDTNRPLLMNVSLEDRINELMNKRGSIYEEVADYTVNTDDKTIEQVVKEMEAIYEDISN